MKISVRINKSNEKAKRKLENPEFRKAYMEKILQEVALQAPMYITRWIKEHNPFVSRTGSAANKWSAKVEGSKVRVGSLMPYVQWLNDGVRPHQMTYLLNSKLKQQIAFGKYPYLGRPAVPIKTSFGTAFRVPTEKAMAQGKWKHPGRKPTRFFEQSLEMLIKDLQEAHPELTFKMELTDAH
jgi:hypothetical protein